MKSNDRERGSPEKWSSLSGMVSVEVDGSCVVGRAAAGRVTLPRQICLVSVNDFTL